METVNVPIDFKILQTQLLKHIRGKRSTRGMSQRLGYSYDQYSKWENGSKKIFWKDFLKIANAKKIPIEKSVPRYFDFVNTKQELTSKVLINYFLSNYFDNQIDILSRYLEVAPSSTRRWISEGADLPLEKILRLFFYRPHNFFAWLEYLQLLDRLPEIQKAWLELKTAMISCANLPFTLSISEFLNMKKYQTLSHHNHQILIDQLKLTEQQIKKGLELLVQAGKIYFDGKKYHQTNCNGNDYKGVPIESHTNLMRYWTYRSLCYTENYLLTQKPPAIPTTRGLRVFSVSASTATKVTQLLRETYLEVLNLIDQDQEPADSLRVLILDHFAVEDSPTMSFRNDETLGLSTKTNEH